MRLAFVFTLMLLLGCPEGRVGPAPGNVAAREAALEFARTFVGRARPLTLHLANTSAARRSVRLQAEAPFVAPASVEVEPGETLEVELQFRPAAPGEASGELEVEADGQPAATVALSGLGALAQACAPSGPCLQADLDPDTGACLETPTGEGQACASACISGGQCRAGACVGTLLDCDDHDPCTTDACDPTRGCLHLPSCPASADPCQVPSCDPARSCALEPAPDGTTCGPSDCQSARVCMSGTCVSRPVPEGAACGEPSPCQPRGVCTAGTCVRGPVEPMRPAWTLAPPPDGGSAPAFWGGTDSAGNLYLLGGTAPSEQSYLESVTPDGYLRFQAPLHVGAWRHLSPPMLVEGLAIVTSDSTVEALRTSDGSEAWRFAVPGDLLHAEPGSPLAADEQGRVFMAFNQFRISTILALSAYDGTLLWRTTLDGYVFQLAGDAQGRLFAAALDEAPQPSPGPGYVARLDEAGQVLWKTRTQKLRELVPLGNHLVSLSSDTDGGSAGLYTLDAQGNASWASLNTNWTLQPWELLGSEASIFGVLVGMVPTGTQEIAQLLEFGSASSTARPITNLAYPVDTMVLTSRGTILVETGFSGSARLDEYAPDGGQLLSCPLPGGTVWGAMLGQGRWYATVDGNLAAFDLPDRSLAPTGWPCAQGNAQQTNFAR